MKFEIDSDFVITPSEEAKICLNCDKPKCNPSICERVRDKKREINNREKAIEKADDNRKKAIEKADEIKEEFEFLEIGSFPWDK